MESRRTIHSQDKRGSRKLQESRRKETADGQSGQVASAPRLCMEEGREGNGDCSVSYKICGSKGRKPSIVTGGGSWVENSQI